MSFGLISEVLGIFLASAWWMLLPILLLPVIASLFVFINHETKKRSARWSLLDIKISREIKKTPQAMEQILATMHGWGGKHTDWTSLEVASFGGEIHFYIRVQEKLKNLMESAFFSFYQDVDIKEADEDYAARIPSNTAELYARGLDAWGTELILDKDGILPIRSYNEFSTGGSEKPDGKNFDPISVLIEILGRIQKEEILGIQMILMPVKTKAVKEKYKPALDKMKEQPPKKEGESPKPKTATEIKVAKAVEENLSKPMFNTLIRVIYVSPKTIFQDNYAKQGILSAFNQYSSPDLNSFKQNDGVAVGAAKSWFFKKKKNEHRKEHILHEYKHRDIPQWTGLGKLFTSTLFHHNVNSKFSELSVESLATIYHPPTNVVLTGPYMQRVESRKVGPPSGLAIFGESSDLEIFQ